MNSTFGAELAGFPRRSPKNGPARCAGLAWTFSMARAPGRRWRISSQLASRLRHRSAVRESAESETNLNCDTLQTSDRNLKSQPAKLRKRRAPAVAGGVCLSLGLLTAAQGQEAVRMSMAGAAAAEGQLHAASTLGYYNLKLGPTTWHFSSGLELEYNSNVINTQTQPEGDFIFLPQLNTRMLWPVSDQNSIDLSLGAGYSAYLHHSELDRPFISPNSGLSFNLYVGDFWINLHDRISITESSYEDPTVAGTGNYSQLQNSLGLTTVWDLNKVIVRFGYDHVNYDSLGGGTGQTSGGQPSGYSEVFSASAGYTLKPGMSLGVQMGGSLINYTTTTTNTPYSQANQWNVGGFYETRVSEYLHFSGSVGYTESTPQAQSSGINAAGTSFGGYYAQLALTHRVNQYVDYSLSGGRSLSVALYGGTVDLYTVTWQANWKVFRKTSLATGFVYNHGSQVIAGGETFDQYGPQITLGRPLTAKLSSSLVYQLLLRDSNLPGRDYTVNVVSLNLNYTF
jgi:hypothetical protein